MCIISPYITRYCKWPVFSTTKFSDVRSGWPWPQCVFLGRHVFAQNQLGDVKPTYDIISYTYTSWGPQL